MTSITASKFSVSDTIVLASGNVGKLKEIQDYFTDARIKFIPQAQFTIDEAEETASTFVENALIKARHACYHTKLPAIADDSGLEVDILDGAPGVYSARYGGIKGDANTNIKKLLDVMQNVPTEKRSARFQCVIVYLRFPKDPSPLICQGTWEGEILLQPSGTRGFGYDPVFYVPSHHCSAAELPLALKNKISHRGQALQLLAKQLHL